jgi:hypothetical protein
MFHITTKSHLDIKAVNKDLSTAFGRSDALGVWMVGRLRIHILDA